LENSKCRHEYELIGEVVSIFCRGSVWYANYVCQGKQYRPSLRTKSKKQARRLAIRLEAEILEGRHKQQSVAPAIKTVLDAYEAHLIAEGRAPTTLAKVRLVARQVLALAEQRGAKNIAAIDLAFIDAYVSERKFKTAKTKLNHLVLIRQAINFARSRKLIAEDPLAGLQLEKVKPRLQPCWTRPQVDQILARADGQYKVSLVLLAESGLRFGELQSLTWSDVDLERGVMLVRPKESWKPKTGDSRSVPIFPAARAVLKELPRRFRWVVTAPASAQYPGGDHPISERRLLRYLKGILASLGLKGHLHTFRHSFISHALTSGIPESVVREWVGHLDHDTIKLYTHVANEISQAAVQRLAAINHQLHQEHQQHQQHQEADHGKSTEAVSAQIQHTQEEEKNA
jgi:site-specific recombinase XerD